MMSADQSASFRSFHSADYFRIPHFTNTPSRFTLPNSMVSVAAAMASRCHYLVFTLRATSIRDIQNGSHVRDQRFGELSDVIFKVH